MITLASLFDGIGGAPLCATMCGAVPVWSSEIEPIPISITKRHFPNMKHYGDITKINGAEVEPVDIIVGGSPCQDLSVAGKRAGLDGARSGLFMEQIRIVKEMRDATNGVQPRFMVWENVPGAFSSNGGEDFRIVLEETARVADPTIRIPRCEAWSNAGSILGDGFSVSWRVLDAQYWGVPQRRRRIYLVADFGGQSAPEILFEREGLSWNIAEGGTERQGTAGDAQTSIEKSRLFTPVNFGEQGQGYRENAVTNTLDATSGSKQTQLICSATQQGGAERLENICPTITAAAGMAGNMGPWIAKPVICLQGNGIDRADTAGCNGKGWTEDVCYTLNTIDRPAVFDARGNGDGGVAPCMTGDHNGHLVEPTLIEMTSTKNTIIENGICPTLTARMGTGGNQVNAVCSSVGGFIQAESERSPTLMARDYKDPHVVSQQNKQVRRLTPKECERLQGYPDNYTNIPGSSDSNRYKALGNSFAIPCALFVISGCVEVMK